MPEDLSDLYCNLISETIQNAKNIKDSEEINKDINKQAVKLKQSSENKKIN